VNYDARNHELKIAFTAFPSTAIMKSKLGRFDTDWDNGCGKKEYFGEIGKVE